MARAESHGKFAHSERGKDLGENLIDSSLLDGEANGKNIAKIYTRRKIEKYGGGK